MATTIITKYGSGAPTASDVVRGELAVDTENGRLYTETSGGAVIEIGLNPSGNVDVTGSITATTDITISNGNNRFVAESTSAGDYVRMYGGSGTGKWDIYGNGANLRIGDNENAGLVQIDTDLYTVGSVGIGTSSPAFYQGSGLEIERAGIATVRLQNTTSGKSAELKIDTDLTLETINTGSDILFNTGATERVRIDSSGNVGIGIASPSSATWSKFLQVEDTYPGVVYHSTAGGTNYKFSTGVDDNKWLIRDETAAATRLTVDSSGNLLVSTTSIAVGQGTDTGVSIREIGRVEASADGNTSAIFNRVTSDGSIVNFAKNGTTVGSIGTTAGDIQIGSGDTALRFQDSTDSVFPAQASGGGRGSAIDLGLSSVPFKDLYLSGRARAAGSTGFPAFASVTDTDTGMNPDGAGNIQFSTQGSEAMRINSSGNVGIMKTPEATNSNYRSLEVGLANLMGRTGGTDWYLNSNAYYSDAWRYTTAASAAQYVQSAGEHFWKNATGTPAADGTVNNTGTWTEQMKLDASGNLLVGKTSTSQTVEGIVLQGADGRINASADGNVAGIFNRLTNDGDIFLFRKDGASVGSIGATGGDLFIGTGDAGLWFQDGGNAIRPFRVDTQVGLDNSISLGVATTGRFDDAFIVNGVTTGSDANDKQDIETLSDAEQRVAVACKGLLRKWRWKDAVEAKGDEARIHFGIIAQDLQAAFEAEGLDAGRYAMFMSNTWTDEETGEERTRLGVRYHELLAFIIAAI